MQSSCNKSYLRPIRFCVKCIFLALIFLYTWGKNPVEKLCKVLEIELKAYTIVGPKFIIEKIKFKVLYYIQHDFIRQRLELRKDQAGMFKSLAINYFDRRSWNTFKNKFWWLYKKRQMFILHKSGCCKIFSWN